MESIISNSSQSLRIRLYKTYTITQKQTKSSKEKFASHANMQMKRVVGHSCKQPISTTYIRKSQKFSPLNFRSVLSFDLSKTINQSIPNQTPKQTKYSQEKFVSNSNMQTTRVVDLSCKQVTGSPAYVRS